MGGRQGCRSGMGRSAKVPSSKRGEKAAWAELTPTLARKTATKSILTAPRKGLGRIPKAHRGVAQSGQSIGLQNRGPRVRILPPLPLFEYDNAAREAPGWRTVEPR